ncbi:MAG: transposase [Pseudomonadota bacterium]
MAVVEIMARVERRRKWTAAEKAALLAEVEAEGGKVAAVARRHRMSESLLYNWRAAWKAAEAAAHARESLSFVPIGMLDRVQDEAAAPPCADPEPHAVTSMSRGSDARAGMIEIELPTGARLRVDGEVNEKSLRRVLQAMKGVV